MDEASVTKQRQSIVTRLLRISGMVHTKSVDWLAVVGGVCIIFIAVWITIDITRRLITGLAIKGSVEVVIFVFVYTYFLAFARTQVEKLHVSITFIKDKFPPRARLILEAVILAITSGWLFFFTWRAILQTSYSFSTAQYQMGDLRLPYGPQYLGVAIGCLVWGIQVVRELVHAIGDIRREVVS